MSLGKWIGILVFVVSLFVLWQIRQMLMLIFAAIVISNALNILVERFQRSGIPRFFAVLLSLFLLLCVLVGFYFLIVPPFAEQFLQLVELVSLGIEQLIEWVEALEADISSELLDQYIPDINQLLQQLPPLINRVLGGGFMFFNNALVVLLNSLLVLVLTLMLLADPHPYRKSFVRLFPSFYRRRVDQILQRCNESLRGWLVGILFNMAVISLLSFFGLLLLGIPLALAQATLAGILTFIPNLGPVVSVIPPIAIALLDSPWKAIAVLILYIVIQQVESNLLTPLVMAQQVSLLPAITLLAQLFFVTFFGFLGLLLALPLTVVAQVWLKEVLVNDILDQWHHPSQKDAQPVATTFAVSPTAAMVRDEEDEGDRGDGGDGEAGEAGEANDK
ncbi:AI-2E family transporter [Coleofasciculus sp.]|uniref:AI-2E family transporter n=1 Tax=Coleofasciculus sp. TaxID=3100458 RepID=UPI003A2C084D